MKPRHFKHGETGTRLHRAWVQMRRRCRDEKYDRYERYAKRGTKVCDEWHHYLTFKEWSLANGYSDNLSLDRIDNDGDYNPSNCRWADQTVQANNRSSSHYLEFDGKKLSIKQWSLVVGINEQTIHERLKRNWTVEKSLTIKTK